jgi:hypothetical protein
MPPGIGITRRKTPPTNVRRGLSRPARSQAPRSLLYAGLDRATARCTGRGRYIILIISGPPVLKNRRMSNPATIRKPMFNTAVYFILMLASII